MAVEQSILVDEHDNIIGYKKRSQLTNTDRTRMVTVWLEDGKGNVLIHKRSSSKKRYPNRWENAAGGGVEKDESYEEAAYKELREELGVDDIRLKFAQKTLIKTSHGEKYCSWFIGITDKKESDFSLESNAVKEVKWVVKEKLFSDRDDHPRRYMPSSAYWRKLFS